MVKYIKEQKENVGIYIPETITAREKLPEGKILSL